MIGATPDRPASDACMEDDPMNASSTTTTARARRRRPARRTRAAERPRPGAPPAPLRDAPPAVWVGDLRQAAQIIAQAPDDAARRLALWTAPDAPPEACLWIATPAAAAAALAPFGARCALRLASLEEARRLGLDAVLAARFPGGVGLPLTLRRAAAAAARHA
jgi:hypothetical protein